MMGKKTVHYILLCIFLTLLFLLTISFAKCIEGTRGPKGNVLDYMCKETNKVYGSLKECEQDCQRSSSSPQPSWQAAVGAAIMVNVLVLVLFFMAVMALHLDQLKGMVYEEAGQLLLTLVIVAAILLALPQIDSFSSSIACAASSFSCQASPDSQAFPLCHSYLHDSGCQSLNQNTQNPPKVLDWAYWATYYHYNLLKDQILSATEFNAKVGAVSSVSSFCNLLGVGISLAGCSAYGVMRGPVGQLISAQGVGIMELEAQRLLILFASKYSLPLLLPLGIILRSLHFSRKAGGTIIALALSIYFVLPLSIILSQASADYFASKLYPSIGNIEGKPENSLYPPIAFNYTAISKRERDAIECNPIDPDEGKFKDRLNWLLAPRDSLNKPVDYTAKNYPPLSVASTIAERIIFLSIVRTLLLGALALTLTISSVRILGRMFGAEIEVWSIARLS
jgi:hypothetical protein